MWNFYKLENAQKQWETKRCILKNCVAKTKKKTDEPAAEESWELFFSDPNTATLWGFWMSLGAETDVPILKQSSDVMPGSVVRTKTPMSDYCKIPSDCVWDSHARVLGKVSFTVDMQTTWSNFVHCRTAKSKIAQMLDLDRDIQMAKRDPFAFVRIRFINLLVTLQVF